MPELPDVEAYRGRLQRRGLRRRVRRVEVPRGGKPFLKLPGARFRRALEGRALDRVTRHGKWLFARAGRRGPWLAVHFGMTGNLRVLGQDEAPPPYTRLLLRFADGGALAVMDQRKFGAATLVEDPGRHVAARGLGPDALAVGREAFVARLRGRRGALKAMLLDQMVVAGLGNLWADEVLWQARLHPATPAAALGEAGLRRLWGTTRRVLRRAAKAPWDPPRAWQLPHRRRGGRCPRCRTPWKQARVGGRTAYFCRRCQPARRSRKDGLNRI